MLLDAVFKLTEIMLLIYRPKESSYWVFFKLTLLDVLIGTNVFSYVERIDRTFLTLENSGS